MFQTLWKFQLLSCKWFLRNVKYYHGQVGIIYNNLWLMKSKHLSRHLKILKDTAFKSCSFSLYLTIIVKIYLIKSSIPMRVITSMLAFTDNAITSSPLPSIKTKPKTVTFADIVHFDNSMICSFDCAQCAQWETESEGRREIVKNVKHKKREKSINKVVGGGGVRCATSGSGAVEKTQNIFCELNDT